MSIYNHHAEAHTPSLAYTTLRLLMRPFQLVPVLRNIH